MERRVLVIDDDAPTGRMIAAVLSRQHYVVDLCNQYEEAESWLDKGEFGAVVLGMFSQNPSIHTGILVRIKAAPKPPPVVILSAGSQLALDALRFENVKARLRKPFRIEDLTSAVEKCFAP